MNRNESLAGASIEVSIDDTVIIQPEKDQTAGLYIPNIKDISGIFNTPVGRIYS